MGQPNAKETGAGASKKKRSPVQRPLQAPSGPGVRPAATDAALLPSASAGTSAGVHHVDPNAQGSGSRSGSVASVKYPIVFRYTDQDVKKLIERKKNVSVCVESLGWKPHPMTTSTDSFYALLELPAGNHNFRFLIDGTTEVVDSTQPLAPTGRDQKVPMSAGAGLDVHTPLPAASPAKDGKPANTIYLNDVLLSNKEDDDIMDDGMGWGQEEVMFEESRKYPPMVPLHLRYTPLNTPPTIVRCGPDGRLAVMEDDHDFTRHMAAEHLPLPLSVTINHVYFQRREDHAVMGVTTRYCNKFTTVVYYTHLPATGDTPLSK